MGYYLGADDRCCLPDDGPVEYEQIEGGAASPRNPTRGRGCAKILEITLRPGSSEAVIRHILRNESGRECLCAPCSVTIMEEGGLEVIPQPCSDTSPRPNRMIAVWPYANMADPRVLWGHQYILLQQASMKRFKLGLSAEQGWVSYFNMGNLFVLRFAPEKGALYPDRGCSFETYTCEDMTDLEVLAPLRPLAPGETAQYEMSFTIFADVACPPWTNRRMAGTEYDSLNTGGPAPAQKRQQRGRGRSRTLKERRANPGSAGLSDKKID